MLNAILIAMAAIGLIDLAGGIIFQKLKRTSDYSIPLSIIVFTATAYFIYRSDSITTGLTLLISGLLGIYDFLVRRVVFIILNKKAGPVKRKSASPFFGFMVMIILSVAFGYVGTILAGGKGSIGTIVIIVLVSFLLIAFLGWLQFGRKKDDIDGVKEQLMRKMAELNSAEDKDQDP